jgi:hypothetical protein
MTEQDGRTDLPGKGRRLRLPRVFLQIESLFRRARDELRQFALRQLRSNGLSNSGNEYAKRL